MSTEDEEDYSVLNKFVDGFFPARWVTREGNDILDEDGEPTFEARPINTKALVECQSYGLVIDLLGFLLYSIDSPLYLFSSMWLTQVHFLCRSHGRTLREIVEADPS